MVHVNGKTFGAGEFVQMDDNYFTNCRFNDGCTIIYTGGDFEWTNCQFGKISISFAGAAQRALKFASHFGIVPPPQAQPPVPHGIPGSSKGEH